jgi:TRAP-type C4-dicarboxylate transport system permease small subunit
MKEGSTRSIPDLVGKVTTALSVVSGIAVTFVLSITIVDILLRAAGRPIIGTFEIVGLSGALIVGCAIPFTSWTRSHVYMEFVLDKLPKKGRNMLNTVTRIACAILFVVIAINLFRVAAGFSASGEVSPTLKLPIYPFAYGLGICCLVQCVVFLCDIIRIWEGRYE